MIPDHWLPHHRDEDGELIGYLRPEEDRHVPVTLFGHSLAEALDEDEARSTLDSLGLSYLADHWWLTLPEREEPVRVQIVEVTPRHMRVANTDFGYEEADYGHVFVLDVPETGRLRAS